MNWETLTNWPQVPVYYKHTVSNQVLTDSYHELRNIDQLPTSLNLLQTYCQQLSPYWQLSWTEKHWPTGHKSQSITNILSAIKSLLTAIMNWETLTNWAQAPVYYKHTVSNQVLTDSYHELRNTDQLATSHSLLQTYCQQPSPYWQLSWTEKHWPTAHKSQSITNILSAIKSLLTAIMNWETLTNWAQAPVYYKHTVSNQVLTDSYHELRNTDQLATSPSLLQTYCQQLSPYWQLSWTEKHWPTAHKSQSITNILSAIKSLLTAIMNWETLTNCPQVSIYYKHTVSN